MREIRKYFHFAAVAAALCAAAACTSYDIMDVSDGDGTMAVSLRLVSTAGISAASTGSTYYEAGTAEENYVDFSGGDYRIFFFTNSEVSGGEDKLITKFEPTSVEASTANGYTDYTVYGLIPDELKKRSSFKVVVLANWGGYTDGDLTAGTTTIDGLCSMAWGQYDATSNYGFNSDFWCPFYGVQGYTGVNLDAVGVHNVYLSTPVCLIRALAKIEVRLYDADEGVEFDSVRIRGYNENGYCAPTGISDGSYVLGSYTWDYSGVHLIGGVNEDQDDLTATWTDGVRRLDFKNTVTADAADPDSGVYETWSVYVPEYGNSGSDYAYIELMLKDHVDIVGSSDPLRIYFTEYSDGTQVDGAANFDIQRNTVYRIDVSILPDGSFLVAPQVWEASFDNGSGFSVEHNVDYNGCHGKLTAGGGECGERD